MRWLRRNQVISGTLWVPLAYRGRVLVDSTGCLRLFGCGPLRATTPLLEVELGVRRGPLRAPPLWLRRGALVYEIWYRRLPAK